MSFDFAVLLLVLLDLAIQTVKLVHGMADHGLCDGLLFAGLFN